MKHRNHPKTLNQIACVILSAIGIAGLVARGHAAEPASPSELLEKGIYSQETKGDLDAAIALYQQVVNEAKDANALAAQAQYRLGVCYYKKKDFAKASATFEKLVRDYPEQKELVKLASEYLAGAVALMPAPWADGEELRLDVKFQSGFKIGVAAYTVNSGETNGHKIWRIGSRLFAGVQHLSRVEVDADSFKPLHSRWKHSLIGDVDAAYASGHVDLKVKGKDSHKKIDLETITYDNEEVIQMMRRLPLETNYSTTIRIITTLGGGTCLPLKIEVPGIEKVEVPAGTFDCFKVELSIHQTFWYSTDPHRYLVKFEAGGVTAELAEIHQVAAGQPVSYQVPARSLSLTVPSGWLCDTYAPDEAKEPGKTVVLDPEAIATSLLFVNSMDNLKPEDKKSLRACAEAQLKDGYKTLAELKVRSESWKEETVAGQPALSLMADFTEGHEKKTAYAVFAFVNTNAVEFLTYAPAADFDAFLPKFRTIIKSLKANNQ